MEFLGYRQLSKSFEDAKELIDVVGRHEMDSALVFSAMIVDPFLLKENGFVWRYWENRTDDERRHFDLDQKCWLGVYDVSEVTPELKTQLLEEFGLKTLGDFIFFEGEGENLLIYHDVSPTKE
jgi:hypothetical protein